MAFRTPAIDRSRAGGFTLVEAMMASVVLSILVFGMGGELVASHEQTAALQQSATAVALGRQLLDEIVCKPLANPTSGITTPTTTALMEPRSQFVAVGDYNLYTDSGSALSMLSGTTVDATGGQTYTRSVTVKLGALPGGDSVSPASDFALVTVSVTPPAGQTVQLQRVVSNYTFTR
jgi:Tfp pilus assembly protein PilV